MTRYVMLPIGTDTGLPVIGFITLSVVSEDQIMEFKERFDTARFTYMPFPVTDHTNDDMGEYI